MLPTKIYREPKVTYVVFLEEEGLPNSNQEDVPEQPNLRNRLLKQLACNLRKSKGELFCFVLLCLVSIIFIEVVLGLEPWAC